MKVRKWLMVLALVLTATIIAGYEWLWRERHANDAITLYGNVDIREVQMAFRQAGRLVRVAVEEGDTVPPGQLLAELDAQPFRENLAAAEAETRQAQAELDKMRRGYRAQEIAEAEQSVRQAEAALAYAAGEVKRQNAVVDAGAITRNTLDQARSVRDQAAARLAAARETLALRKEGFRREDIAAAEARLARAEATLAQARTALNDTRLVAADQAVVLARVREPGSMVNPSAPVLTLSLRDPVYIRAYAGERNLGQLVPGTRVTVRTDSSAKTYHGEIGFVSPRAEFTPKSVETTDLRTDLVYRLRIVVTDADEALRQGMPVTVVLERKPTGP